MATRTGSAVWEGTLKDGKGNMKLGAQAKRDQTASVGDIAAPEAA